VFFGIKLFLDSPAARSSRREARLPSEYNKWKNAYLKSSQKSFNRSKEKNSFCWHSRNY